MSEDKKLLDIKFVPFITCVGIIMFILLGLVNGILWLFCPHFYNSISIANLPNFSSFSIGLYSAFYMVAVSCMCPLIFFMGLLGIFVVLKIVGLTIQIVFEIMFG